jgi:hypothetical protein
LFHGDGLRFNVPFNIVAGESSIGQSSSNFDPRTGLPFYDVCARREISDVSPGGCPLSTWSAISATVPGINDGKQIKFDTSVLVPVATGSQNYSFNRTLWLYGHSYLVKGNWQSQAFIPIISAPVWDTVTRNGYPAIERLVRGIDFTTAGAPNDQSVQLRYQNILMRYFLDNVDSKLSEKNEMVFWFNSNQPIVRRAVPVETYNSEQIYQFSYTTALPDELNVIRHTMNPEKVFPGMVNDGTDDRGRVVNTGFVHFFIPEVKYPVTWYSAGVAFNLLYLAPPGNTAQIQTEMATGLYDLPGPF